LGVAGCNDDRSDLNPAHSRALGFARLDGDYEIRFLSVRPEADCLVVAFRAHCCAHRENWQWLGERNEWRFVTNVPHGCGYDSKNLMHTIRLLEMAGEIADEGNLRVRRPDWASLLEIRSGCHGYEDLVARAEDLHGGLAERCTRSPLPESPVCATAKALLLEIRAAFL